MKNDMKYVFVCLLLIGGGCCSQRTSPLSDVAIISNIYSFRLSNPYTSDELASANSYLAAEVERAKLQDFVSVYFIPMEGSNRLIFVPIRPDYKPALEVRTKIAEGLGIFLETHIKDRRTNQNQPDKVGWIKQRDGSGPTPQP